MARKTIFQLVCVVASFATLLWLLSRIGWSAISTALSGMSFLSALLLFLLAICEGVFDGLSLRVITGPRLRIARAVAVNSAGSILNLILPWESGEVLKGGLLNENFGPSRAASSTITWNYIFKISRPALSMSTAVIAAVLCRHTVRAGTLGWVLGANVLAFAPYALLRFAIRYGGAEKLVRLARRLPYLRRSSTRWVEVARSVDREVRSFWTERPWAFVQVFLLQVVARTTGWLNIYIGFIALGMPYGFSEATLIYATMNVAEYLIAILPARVGVAEGTAFFVFRFYGLDASMGVVLYSFLRIRNILVHGLITPFAFLHRRSPRAPTALPAATVTPP